MKSVLTFKRLLYNFMILTNTTGMSHLKNLVVTSEVELHGTVLSVKPYKESSYGFTNRIKSHHTDLQTV